MGLIDNLFSLVFGNGRNAISETAEVFRENAEAGAKRDAQVKADVLKQFGAEFSIPQRGVFDRVMDAINRIPRPAMALGTLALFVAAMADPVWFAERMQGIALVPEPLWWLLGAIVSFYFGARHQMKSQEFQRSLAVTVAMAPKVKRSIQALRALDDVQPGSADPATDAVTSLHAVESERNAALEAWRQSGPKER